MLVTTLSDPQPVMTYSVDGERGGGGICTKTEKRRKETRE
jgi:hypothetical protein